MNYRSLGKTNWKVSELGHGMWGMGDWTGSDDTESLAALHRSVELGVNFLILRGYMEKDEVKNFSARFSKVILINDSIRQQKSLLKAFGIL